MSVASQIEFYRNELPSNVKLVAVSKFKPSSAIMEAYQAGQRVFGENRPQELAAKAKELPADIEWHFIGHLQTNKVKLVVPCASVIESVDSERVLAAIDSCAASMGKVTDCFVEVHVAEEETKTGFSPEEALELVPRAAEKYPNVHLCGIMAMATFTSDEAQVRAEFARAAQVCRQCGFENLSMGMSEDYKIAIEEGATIVRIGSAIFGSR